MARIKLTKEDLELAYKNLESALADTKTQLLVQTAERERFATLTQKLIRQVAGLTMTNTMQLTRLVEAELKLVKKV